MKFKKGNTIVCKEYCNGFEKATVIDTFEENGKQYYKLKIMNGIATIPVGAEINYELEKK